jgi:dynein heavy chain
LCGAAGWYDLVENEFRVLMDQVIIAAMGPPGGGRNDITPRMMRHFNLICVSEFDDKTLRRIFSTIVQWCVERACVGGSACASGCVVLGCGVLTS